MLPKLCFLLSINPTPSDVSHLLSTTPLNLYNIIQNYFINKYKIFLSSELSKDDLLGLGLVMHCDINNIKLEDEILDFYYEVLIRNKMKDATLITFLIKENEELKNKLEVEHEVIKEAWYEMCKNKLSEKYLKSKIT